MEEGTLKFFKDTICKLLSGRFILTLIAGFTFAYLSCTEKIESKDALITISVITTFYFTKNRNNTELK